MGAGSIMSAGSSSGDDSQGLKKRKLDQDARMGEQTERDTAAEAEVPARGEFEPVATAGSPPLPTVVSATNDKQRIVQLLEPFSREQLLEILTSAAALHTDVLEEIKAIASADVAHRKVFVRGLAWETTTDRLKAAFALFGEVEEGAVIYDKATSKSRGYGFVTFVDMDGAQRAVEAHSVEIDGRRTTCNLAAIRAQGDDHQLQQQHPAGGHSHQPQHHLQSHQPPPMRQAPAQPTQYATYSAPMHQQAYAAPPPPPAAASQLTHDRGQNDEADRKLFVRGLSWDTTDESLRGEFQKFGELVEASVVRDRKTGKSKGFGFVTYAHRAAAGSALQQPHKIIDGRNVTCNLASLGRSTLGNPQTTGQMIPAQGMSMGGQPYPSMQPPYAPTPQPMHHQPMMQGAPVGPYGMYAAPIPGSVPVPTPGNDPYRQHYAYGGAPPAPQYYAPPAPTPMQAPQPPMAGRRK